MPWPSGASEVKFWKTAVYLPAHFSQARLHNSKSAFLFMVRKETIRVIIQWLFESCHKKKGEAVLCIKKEIY